ncbi:unnamed protein product [Rhodiola kirilowii]
MGFLCLQTLVLSSSPGCELVLLRGSKNSREAVKQYGYLCIEFCCIRLHSSATCDLIRRKTRL